MDRVTVETLQLIVGIVGIALIVHRLRADHDQNRRNAALTLLLQWDTMTHKHRIALEAYFPGILNAEVPNPLSETVAKKIYDAHPERDPLEWQLRFHLIALLNYFEAVASVLENRAADARMIEGSFRVAMLNYHRILHFYIGEVSRRRNGKNPWEPYSRVVDGWLAEEGRQSSISPRPQTA